MGRYISLSFQLPATDRSLAALNPIFRNEYFRPVGVGGWIDKRLVIGGYGLEYFATNIQSQASRPASVLVCRPGCCEDLDQLTGNRNAIYAADVGHRLRRRESLARAFSEHEHVVPDVAATYFDGPSLERDTLEAVENALASASRWSIRVYGTIHIAVSEGSSFRCSEAFRYLVDDSSVELTAIPLLEVWIHSNPPVQERTTVELYSQSTIWLADQDALRGHVGPDESDWNLEIFRHLAEFLRQSGPQPLSSDLTLSGSAFHNESERIAGTLSEQITSVQLA